MNLETNSDLPWDLVGPTTGGLAIGIVLQGTYRIIRPLAEGGCGEVYLAAHTRLPGRFAVKLLHRSLVRDKDALSRFRQEAEITSSLRHPHIVQVFDFNVTDSGVPFLVMELLEGKLLSERVRAAGPLDPLTASNIIEQIAGALHAAHARGIVHRDLKPENVMLLGGAGVDDFVKVMDFGISQASWRPRLTEGERVAGTPQYMAPEQAQGLREQIDHRSDQFSLAAIAYTLLTGQEPFRGENPIAVLYEVVHSDPIPRVGAGAEGGPGDRGRGHARARQGVGRPLSGRARVRQRAARRDPGVDTRAVRGRDQRAAAGAGQRCCRSRGAAGSRAAVRGDGERAHRYRGSAHPCRPGATPSGSSGGCAGAHTRRRGGSRC